ncbi:energy transducer TonB, partial [Christiangramia aquimixticola]|uniref:energy transducer TonB n=1 Tax=Christiangramia aquimixticola TaxID=1697558 RepID=UPI003AA7EA5A
KRIFMLQKNKSSKLSKFKLLLIVPLMLAMLTYVACSDNKTEEEIDSTLSQFNYSLNKVENLEENLEKKKTHEAYENFLINNPDYVSWATINYNSDQVSYSIHKASEKVPDGYNKMVVTSKDGNEYTMYMNLKATGPESTSATKNLSQKSNLNDSEESQNMPELVLNDNDYIKNQNFNTESAHPFATIDIAPAFPGCEELSGESRKECTSQKISAFIGKHFNSNIGKELNIKEFNRILVHFKIDQTGKIVETRARATHKELKEEAIRVINNLPNMKPGQHNGKKVTVTYTLPIVFQVDE